jgi:error-prone DNA polymerase
MLQMAMVIANFTGDEAEELRRAISSFNRSEEKMDRVTEKLRAAMERNQVKPEVAERIVKAVGSFALYGFPESHAISFALLAYASAYLKVHRAPEFYCGLFNNQPMGFYSPATLVKDAKRNGVTVRAVCAERSQWETVIEEGDALRLGFHHVQGLRRNHLQKMLEERARKPFASLDDFKARTNFGKEELRTLAEIGALNCFAPHRRAALWEAEREVRDDELFASLGELDTSPLRPMDNVERLQADYSGLGLTTGPHPMAIVRKHLPDVWRAEDLKQVIDGQTVRVAGLVICRQRPGTAKGVCFVSLEDETGISNAIVDPKLFEAERLTITMEPFLTIEGPAQHRHGTIHIKARKIERLAFAELNRNVSHDFH